MYIVRFQLKQSSMQNVNILRTDILNNRYFRCKTIVYLIQQHNLGKPLLIDCLNFCILLTLTIKHTLVSAYAQIGIYYSVMPLSTTSCNNREVHRAVNSCRRLTHWGSEQKDHRRGDDMFRCILLRKISLSRKKNKWNFLLEVHLIKHQPWFSQWLGIRLRDMPVSELAFTNIF